MNEPIMTAWRIERHHWRGGMYKNMGEYPVSAFADARDEAVRMGDAADSDVHYFQVAPVYGEVV